MSDNFQSDASGQGRKFEEICNDILIAKGFTLLGSKIITRLGIEVDQVAISGNNETYWFEFKGSWKGRRPGMIRTDTTKKGLCNALLAHVDTISHPKFIIMSSHLPKPDSSGDNMCKIAKNSGALYDLICVFDLNDVNRYSNDLNRLLRL